MDVGFPPGVQSINPDILVQQMSDCQIGLNAEYSNELTRIVVGLRRSLQDYLDRNHPGLAVPQNGYHSQFVKSSLEDLALMQLEILDVDTMFDKCWATANSLLPRIDMITEMDSVQPILDAIADVKQLRLRCEQTISKLTLDSKKMLDLAQRSTEDISYLGRLRKGIATVMEERVNLYLQMLQKLGDGFEDVIRGHQDLLIGFVNAQIRLLKSICECRDRLTEALAKPRANICPDVFTALHDFCSIPGYFPVLMGELFHERIRCVFQQVKKEELLQLNLDTLPYEALNHLLETMPSTTEKGRNLRRKMMDNKAIHSVLDYFAGKAQVPSLSSNANEIGFEMGPHSSSSASTGKVEKVLSEEKITWILNVVLNFIGFPQAGDEDSQFLSEVHVLLKNSSIMSVLADYLAKDSAFKNLTGPGRRRPVPLIQNIFKLLGLIASISQLSPLLISDDGESAIFDILESKFRELEGESL